MKRSTPKTELLPSTQLRKVIFGSDKMKASKLALLLVLTFLSFSRAEEARFFRVTGPVATTIAAFNANGYMTWTNAPTNATFTIQTASSLLYPINWVDYVQVPATNPVTTHKIYDLNPPVNMALIPAGSFTMGDTFVQGSPLYTVYISAFYIDKFEVTKALWDEVYQWATNRPGELRYSFDSPGSWSGGVNYSKGQNHPVHIINWYDAVKWCNARSEKEGMVPAYYAEPGLVVRYRSDQLDPWVNWGSGYRLPTQAEWEKAARGGASGHRFPWADTDNITHSRANYYSSTGIVYDTSPTRGYHPTFNDGVYPFTSPAGYFAPNGYGLYDMMGNLSEWCWDRYSSTYYNSSPGTDPRGPTTGTNRVFKGASWINGVGTAWYSFSRPSSKAYDTGFRSVRPPAQ